MKNNLFIYHFIGLSKLADDDMLQINDELTDKCSLLPC